MSDLQVFSAQEQRVLESLPAPLAVFHMCCGRMSAVLVSDGLCHLAHASRSALMRSFQSPVPVHIHPDDRSRLQLKSRYLLTHPEESFHLTYRASIPFGSDSYQWVGVNGNRETRGNGSILYYMTYFNINERQELLGQRELEKRQIESVLRQILDTAQSAIFWKDMHGHYLGANQVFLEYNGFSKESDIIGHTGRELGLLVDPPEYWAQESSIIQDQNSIRGEYARILQKGNETRCIIVSRAPLTENGRVIGLVGNFIDITQQYQQRQKINQLNSRLKVALENERINSQAKTSFLSTISHDLRTPINGILGFSNLGLSSQDSDELHLYMEKIKSSGTFLLKMLTESMNAAQIEDARTQLNRQIFDNRELISSIAAQIQPLAERRQIHFTINGDSQPFRYIRADRRNLEKILLQLLRNAIQFTQKGGTVELSLERLDPMEHDANCRLTVRDNGIGISQQFLPKMFRMFEQESPDSDPKHRGIGLAVVKDTLDLMHGHIEVNTQKGKGSEFILWIYLEEVSNYHPGQQTAAHDYSILEGRKILICEDHPMNLDVEARILKNYGMKTVSAINGALGLNMFSSSGIDEIDAIIMDLQMPIMDGIEASKSIRHLDRPDALDVPIIALSGDAFNDNNDRTQEAGINDLLPKPFETDQLLTALSRQIRLRQEKRDQAQQ